MHQFNNDNNNYYSSNISMFLVIKKTLHTFFHLNFKAICEVVYYFAFSRRRNQGSVKFSQHSAEVPEQPVLPNFQCSVLLTCLWNLYQGRSPQNKGSSPPSLPRNRHAFTSVYSQSRRSLVVPSFSLACFPVSVPQRFLFSQKPISVETI